MEGKLTRADELRVGDVLLPGRERVVSITCDQHGFTVRIAPPGRRQEHWSVAATHPFLVEKRAPRLGGL
jgi:hypothetical protein